MFRSPERRRHRSPTSMRTWVMLGAVALGALVMGATFFTFVLSPGPPVGGVLVCDRELADFGDAVVRAAAEVPGLEGPQLKAFLQGIASRSPAASKALGPKLATLAVAPPSQPLKNIRGSDVEVMVGRGMGEGGEGVRGAGGGGEEQENIWMEAEGEEVGHMQDLGNDQKLVSKGVLTPEQREKMDQEEAAKQQQPSPAPLGPKVADRSGTAVLVMCYNRPDYLKQTLESIIRAFPSDEKKRPVVYVSQDGHSGPVRDAVMKMRSEFFLELGGVDDAVAASQKNLFFEHWEHPQEQKPGDDRNGYAKLSRHFGFALDRVFQKGHARVILVEDDLEVSPDFFDFFDAITPLVDSDPSILAASAYNDLGQRGNVADPSLVIRSDFFPGLGWMMPKRIWEELGPRWPNGYWDDWMREPPQRRGRHVIRPEVSRSRTFGKVGVSQSQFFNQYLATIQLNEVKVHWNKLDLSYLERHRWDQVFSEAVTQSTNIHANSITTHHEPNCMHASEATAAKPLVTGLRVDYLGLDGPGRGGVPSLQGISRQLGLMHDPKAGVPRTSYRGVITIVKDNCRIYITPQDFKGTIE